MSDVSPERPATTAGPFPLGRPPWWLVTSWGRWAFWVVYPILMSIGPITRIRDGRDGALDVPAVIVLSGCFIYGVILHVMTLLAYRRDPSLRNRKWPPPARARRLSRKVKRTAALLAILALGVVLLIYTGWAAALYVTVILGGAAIAIDRFDLFTDDVPPVKSADTFPQLDRNPDNPTQ